MEHMPPSFITGSQLRADLEALGLTSGDVVMVHAAISRVGPLLDGPDTVIAALRDVVGPRGTVVAYTDWETRYHELLDDRGLVPPPWRAHIIPFDPSASRAVRSYGVLPEFVRTCPGARRSGNPGASVAALGVAADELTAAHPLDYGYGPGSPLGRIVDADASIVMLGAPHDTMTVLHHAEHLAALPDKRVIRYEAPLLVDGRTTWRVIEEFDTARPVAPLLDGVDPDPFAVIVDEFLSSGRGQVGTVGLAPTVVVRAREVVDFAVAWFEARAATR